MARGRPKRVKNSSSTIQGDLKNTNLEELQVEKKLHTLSGDEVKRRIAAIQAIRDIEVEDLRTQLRLFRAYFSKEQLETPVIQFFKENLPNLSLIFNERDGEFELARKVKDRTIPIDYADEKYRHTSFLQQKAYPDCAAAMPDISGFEFSMKTNFLAATNLQIPDFVLEEPSETQMQGLHDTLQTPVVTSQRISVGTTPKTLRLPKHGEMLLSVHGSPLGMYKEENMEVIDESEEG
ncbi:uncharacterized protein LOC143883336 isoform X2 [Tasmannia lanceolata]|uniref:uncharacterized protein LOC143883336 isoform X2 n=1 Tax=Tasmannia lanceolata TaxID=3420 RepID=UPI00406427DE